MIKLHISIFFLLTCCKSFSQQIQNKSLLDSAINYSDRLFVNAKPVKILNLDKKELWRYDSWTKLLKRIGIDTPLVFQLIDNSKHPDTAIWTDGELSRMIIIYNPREQIHLTSAIHKLKPVSTNQILYYSIQVKNYNDSPAYRYPYSFSRPVYDNSKLYAIVQCDSPGGGHITLYHLVKGIWGKSGLLANWVY